ncbi:MAG: DNA repair protein RadC [Pseudomonadota bacterium]
MKFQVFETSEPKFPDVYSTSNEVYESMKHYQKAGREMFFILFLNTKNRMIDYCTHTIGSIDSSAVYPREVIKAALLNDAASVIFCHNHPSGDPAPSENDKEITKHLVIACEIVGIKVLDHIILGRDNYFSFADCGSIGEYQRQSKYVMNQTGIRI